MNQIVRLSPWAPEPYSPTAIQTEAWPTRSQSLPRRLGRVPRARIERACIRLYQLEYRVLVELMGAIGAQIVKWPRFKT